MSLPGWLVRNVTYPAHERLRGRRTLTELTSLHNFAHLTPAQFHTEVAERLRNLLTFAAARLPYYHALITSARLDLHAEDPFTELTKLPVLNKADIRAHTDQLVWRNVPGGLIPHSSGGTTGDTLRFFIDRQRQAQDLAARLFMQSRFGVPPGARRLHLWGSPIESRGTQLKRWRDRLLNEALINSFRMSPEHMDAHLVHIARFQPAVIYGYPTALALLARHACTKSPRPTFPSVKLVVLTGEEVTDDQTVQVREVFDCHVAGEYGNREVGLIAHDCPAGHMHLLWPHIHVDVTAGNGHTPTTSATSATSRQSETTRDNEPVAGDIVCTTLTTRAQPFIRYRVGDIGRLLAEPCSCGLPFPTMQLTGGKITGFIALPDGRLCHGAVTSHILRGESGIVAYKTYQHTLHEFEVLLVTDESFDTATIGRVQERYRALFSDDIDVDCRVVDEIPPDPSGKHRYVVSAVAPDLARFEVVTPP